MEENRDMTRPILIVSMLAISAFQTAQASEPGAVPEFCVEDKCVRSGENTGYQFPSVPTSESNAQLKAVATFHSVSLYWDEPSASEKNEALVRFRPLGSGPWRQGLSLWFDSRDSSKVPYGSLQYRGSLVELEPNTSYEIEALALDSGKLAKAQIKTWSEKFPVGQTVTLPAQSSSTLRITQSGTPSGYRLYTAASGGSTIDGNNKVDELVVISASYVILRGVTLRNSRISGIYLTSSAHHVVIEDNDISYFGRADPVMPQFGCKDAAGITTENSTWPANSGVRQIVIQNNRIHHPNFDSNSWDEPRQASTNCGPPAGTSHPAGARAVYFKDTAGNHVIRYNRIYSDLSRMFDDGIGGGQNFSVRGPYGSDSDIYGNFVSHVWDDAIESEGANQNVRIYNNYTELTMVAVAAAPVSIGPLYVFRNVATKGVRGPTSIGGEGWFFKTRNKSADGSISGIMLGSGRIYLFHNTLYRTSLSDSVKQMLSLDEISCVNIISRNNVMNSRSAISSKFIPMAYSNFDNDLYPKDHAIWSEEEKNGIQADAVYDGTGVSGRFALRLGSPGQDAAVPIPNFNDRHRGSAPDAGAQELDANALVFGERK
jgi:hypothetical protein